MTEFLEAIFAQLIGNIATLLLVVLIYFNFLLFETYWRLIIWAILFSQALRQTKTNVISVLRFLSDHPSVAQQGFVTSAFTKSFDVFLSQSLDGTHKQVGHQDGKAAKEILLNYGIFLFSLIGAVSIWLRMYSWVSFLHFCVGFALVGLCALKFLNQRLFWYRYFISDEVLVSTVLIVGFFTTGICVLSFLGSECYREGSRAAMDVAEWVQDNFVNDETTRKVWHEQVHFGREMFASALGSFETNYNDTMWWPPLKRLVKTYYLDAKQVGGNGTSPSLEHELAFPANLTLIEAMTFAYSKVDSVNLVQWRGWTLKGLEVSSLAFGSLSQLLLLIVTMLIAFVSLGIRAFFFVSSLFYLLCTKWDPIERFVEDLLPIQPQTRPVVVRSVRRVIGGVVFLPLKMSSLHAIITLVSLTIVDADFVYLGTTCTFIISIVPIIPPYLVCLPWVFATWNTSFIRAAILFAVHYVGFSILDEALYEKSIFALNSYVSALSVVFGVYVFGIEGVIFGPLVVCGVYFAYEASNHGIQAAQDEFVRHPEDAQAPNDLSSDEVDKLVSPRGHENAQDADSGYDPHGIKSSPKSRSRVSPPVSPSANRRESNIFSDAYRVISGRNRGFMFTPFTERMKRRLSIDCSSYDAVCVTLVLLDNQTCDNRKLRFAVNKTWTQKTFLDSLKQFLRVPHIEGVYTPDGAEVLSPLHVFPHETLHVRVRSKRPTMESPAHEGSAGPFAAPVVGNTNTLISSNLRTPKSLPTEGAGQTGVVTGPHRSSGKTPIAKRRPRRRTSNSQSQLMASMTPSTPANCTSAFAQALRQALEQEHKDKKIKMTRDDSDFSGFTIGTTSLLGLQGTTGGVVDRKRSSSLKCTGELARQLEKYQLEFQKTAATATATATASVKTDPAPMEAAATETEVSSSGSEPATSPTLLPPASGASTMNSNSTDDQSDNKPIDVNLAHRRKFLFSPLSLKSNSKGFNHAAKQQQRSHSDQPKDQQDDAKDDDDPTTLDQRQFEDCFNTNDETTRAANGQTQAESSSCSDSLPSVITRRHTHIQKEL